MNPRIFVWPAGIDDNDATTQYRLILPALALRDKGADITITRTGPTVVWSEPWDAKTRTHPPEHVQPIAIAERPECDIVVMQRPNRKWWATVIPMLQALGIRCIVDVDDRYDQIHKDNVAHGYYDPKNSEWSNHQWISEACRHADAVTCTTKSLAKRYGYGHAHVLPNRVPARYLRIPRNPIPNTIGWSGAVETHPTDLQVTGGSIQRALENNPDWVFHAIGHGTGVQQALGLANPPMTTQGWVPFDQYPEMMANLDIGIVPLDGIVFNEGKSWLKMSELASLGIPVVASPTADNVRLHKMGVGLLAASPNQWFKKVNALMQSRDFRDDLGGRSREVMQGMTYEQHSDGWWKAWTGSTTGQPAIITVETTTQGANA